ncbi:MAG: AtpZ/AtpI family protein [Hyphomicrobiales bacterium]
MLKKRNKKQLNQYTKYSSIAFQLIFIIVLGVYGGIKVDEWLDIGYPIFTLIGAIISIPLAIYYSLKDFMKRK